MDHSDQNKYVFKPMGRAPILRNKRSNQIAEEIKRWTVYQGLEPGQRLPKEQELAEFFSCGRSTVREALKALEVQGFVSVRTGPKGGAILKEPSYARAAEQLRSHLNFRALSLEDLYQTRLIIEPAMARAVIAVVDDDLIAALNKSVSFDSSKVEESSSNIRDNELDYHIILAQNCPNPLLSFQSQFITNLLREFIQFDDPDETRFDKFTRDNCHYHTQMIEAYQNRDADKVEALMFAHMKSAYQHSLKLDATMSSNLLVSLKDSTPSSATGSRSGLVD